MFQRLEKTFGVFPAGGRVVNVGHEGGDAGPEEGYDAGVACEEPVACRERYIIVYDGDAQPYWWSESVMAKQFGCGDVVQGCKFTVTTENEAEVLAHVARHAAAAHGIKEVTPELMEKVRAAMKDVPRS